MWHIFFVGGPGWSNRLVQPLKVLKALVELGEQTGEEDGAWDDKHRVGGINASPFKGTGPLRVVGTRVQGRETLCSLPGNSIPSPRLPTLGNPSHA